MEADRQRLVDRILKLLALSAGTTFEAEADTARRMANELMAKHNIDVTAGAKNRAAMVIELYTPTFKGMRWEFILADAVGDLCGCQTYWTGDFVVFKFAGLIPDVEACLYIIAKLHEQRIGQWLAYKRTGADSFHKFCYGFAVAVADKVALLIRPMSVIKAASEAARLWFLENNKVFEEPIRLGAASSGAGLAAGGNASFHRGEMGSTAPQKRLR